MRICPGHLSLTVSSSSQTGQLVVEAGDHLLPGTGVELLRGSLPLTEEFQQNLARTHLETVSSSPERCGVVYLIASLLSDSGDMIDFDSLQLTKKCSDSPGLSLKVVRNSEKVK